MCGTSVGLLQRTLFGQMYFLREVESMFLRVCVCAYVQDHVSEALSANLVCSVRLAVSSNVHQK